MYCTLDTSNVDMEKLLGNQLAFNHTIYAHVRGQTKEVRFTKKAEKLGITLADNKAGRVFIKRITPGSVLDEVVRARADSVTPGDMIECINGRAFFQCRHLDVMYYLKALPIGSDIVFRLISPEKSLLPGISKRQKQSSGIFGRQTIRITATKAEIIAALNEEQTLVVKKMAEIVDEFLGIADEELAQTVFDIANTSSDREEFLQNLQKHLSAFNFPQKIALKFWWVYETYEAAVINRRKQELSPK
ncbi:unnamed protein product [Schistocephalus solidus]|uniref:PDZ domain-containing protein n=1 Tax=Schistocephalus solidus TaxID=70667 RepID=A0A183TCN6_SCHSO|nr:unnamed protein product [Schistocephalus solidus]